VRINAAARLNGLAYSKFIHGLKLAQVQIDRKVLADIALSDPQGFAEIAALSKANL
jgi:large subunit ribosomal protein L20